MKIAVIALTKNGVATAVKLSKLMDVDAYGKFTGDGVIVFNDKLSQLIARIYDDYEGFIFIMATGIVIRTMMPYVSSKDKDKPVVVMDELGHNVISLLAGHLGGANDIAREVAYLIGGNPVITTSTDLNSMVAFDLVAKNNDLIIEDISQLKYISSHLVNGDTVYIKSDVPIADVMPANIKLYDNTADKLVVITNKIDIPHGKEATLILRPKNLVLGVGCKRGTDVSKFDEVVIDFMKNHNYEIKSVVGISSIDLKEDEEAIIQFAEKYGITTQFYSSEMLNKVADKFSQSDFVKETTGVGNVCETAGYISSFGGKELVEKTSYNGITIALFEIDMRVYLGGTNG